MITRREFLILGGGALAAPFLGCGGSIGGAGVTAVVRSTVRWTLRTADADLAGAIVRIATNATVARRQAQAGVFQQLGLGIVEGRVEDSSGTTLAGLSVGAFDEAGGAVGPIVYRGASGTLEPSLSATTSDGGFMILNVPPGRYLLRVTAGGNGFFPFSVTADGAAVVELVAQTGIPLFVQHSGATRNGSGTLEPSVTLRALGVGAPFPVVSDATGAFGPLLLPANGELVYRLSKAGFIDTYTFLRYGMTSISQDLQVFTTAERDAAAFKPASISIDPAKGIVSGIVRTSAGAPLAGAAVAASSGTVVYSDAGGSADDALTATTASGEFTVFNCVPGPVALAASAAGLSAGLPVEAVAGAIMLVPDALRLTAAAALTVALSGTTTDLDAAPVGGVSFSIAGVGTAVSGADGAFSIAGLPSHARLVLSSPA
ncbi:MAG: carboxypeptidase regulatory-like domain-containing protein [Planctomycetes bacterium]|nr:carboxypeptidase regulatory-like domain-containing protein [Planctomycetota bacterium]